MTWSATKTTASASYWSYASAWTPTGVPTINDYVEIDHVLAIDTDALCAGLKIDAELWPTAGKSLTVKDAAPTHATGEHIRITDTTTAAWMSTATASSPFTVRSQNANPNYPIKWHLMKVSGADARRNDFTYTVLNNSASFLGNQTNYAHFNTGDVTADGILFPPAPPNRALKSEDHYCEGRVASRVYIEGGYAATISLEGLVPWATWKHVALENMRDAHERVAFIGQYVTMPCALIESLRFGRRDGPYIPFSLTLVEDL